MPVDCFLTCAGEETANISLLLSAFLISPCHHLQQWESSPEAQQPPSLSDTKTDCYITEAMKTVLLPVKLKAEHRYLKICPKSRKI